MCRELNREPAWVGAIRLAFTRGEVTVEGVVEEANLVPGRERTVRDVLSTMEERGLLERPPDHEETDRYVAGPTLRRSAPSPKSVRQLSSRAVHQWE